MGAVFNEELNDKYIIHLTDKQYNAEIKNAQNDINQKWIQKVKEKIEELDKKVKDYQCVESRINLYQREVLQELLEESEE